MPDIAMCTRRDCPRRASCYRYLAYPDSAWQTYFSPDPETCTRHMAVLAEDPVRSVLEVDTELLKLSGWAPNPQPNREDGHE